MLVRRVKAGNEIDIFAIGDVETCEVLDFIAWLKASNMKEFDKLIRLFDWTADIGKLRNEEKFKLLYDDIYEFKTHGGVRILCFFDGSCTIVLTNGFMKKKKYDSEIKRAVNLMWKYVIAKEQRTLIYLN